MEVQLMNGEKVLHSWDYAKAKGYMRTKLKLNLTVTDSRVVSTVEGKNTLKAVSININEIRGVNAQYGQQRIGIIKTILTLGIALFFRKASLNVSFCMDASDYDLISSQHNGGFLSKIFGSNKSGQGVKKIRVERKAAREIASNLSTIIYNINNPVAEK